MIRAYDYRQSPVATRNPVRLRIPERGALLYTRMIHYSHPVAFVRNRDPGDLRCESLKYENGHIAGRRPPEVQSWSLYRPSAYTLFQTCGPETGSRRTPTSIANESLPLVPVRERVGMTHFVKSPLVTACLVTRL